MKNRKAIAFAALLTLCCITAGAQNQLLHLNEPDHNKPKIFYDLPERMNLKIQGMDSLFQLPVGSAVRTRASDDLLIEGTIVSKSDGSDPRIHSVVIRLSNRPGAVFTFTRSVQADGSMNYLGRILSLNNADAYEVKFDKGQYVLLKKNLNDMLSE